MYATTREILARIEVSPNDLPRLVELDLRGELIATFRSLGFKFVTLDLEGFRSGSMNSVIPVESLLRGVSAHNARATTSSLKQLTTH